MYIDNSWYSNNVCFSCVKNKKRPEKNVKTRFYENKIKTL